MLLLSASIGQPPRGTPSTKFAMSYPVANPLFANSASDAESVEYAGVAPATKLLGFTIILLLLTQRLALPLGALALPLATPLVLAVAVWGLYTRILAVDRRRLLAYLIAVSLLIVSSIFVSIWGSFSVSSLVYLMGLYTILVLAIPSGDPTGLFRIHQKAMLVFAVLGVLQFVVQLVGVPFIDPFAGVPEALMLPNYNTIQPLSYGADLIKPNAGFFLEASHLSKALAFAILIELLYFRRLTFLAIFLCCYGFTFSGTGLVALAVGVATGLRYIPKQWLLGGAALSVMMAIGVAATGLGDIWVERATEFNKVESSGSIRFVTPYARLLDVLKHDFRFFGNGAGSVEETFTLDGGVIAFDPTPVKLIYEYGIIPGAVFMAFMLYCLYTGSALLPLRHLAVVVLFFLTGGLLEAVTLYYCFLMVGVMVPASRLTIESPVPNSHAPAIFERNRKPMATNVAT